MKPAISSFFNNLAEEGSDFGREMIYRARAEANRFKRKLIKTIISTFMLLLGFIVLLASASFFLIDYLHVTRTLVLLIVGVILLIIGIIAKL